MVKRLVDKNGFFTVNKELEEEWKKLIAPFIKKNMKKWDRSDLEIVLSNSLSYVISYTHAMKHINS